MYFHLKMHWVKVMKSYRAEDYAGTGGMNYFI